MEEKTIQERLEIAEKDITKLYAIGTDIECSNVQTERVQLNAAMNISTATNLIKQSKNIVIWTTILALLVFIMATIFIIGA